MFFIGMIVYIFHEN